MTEKQKNNSGAKYFITFSRKNFLVVCISPKKERIF
jgi:hypothetical protein